MSLVPPNSSRENITLNTKHQGKPRGVPNKKTSMKVSDRLLRKWKTHPADRLIEIANFLMNTGKSEDMIESAAIWQNLLKYFEPTKKPVESAPEKTTPEEAKEAAEETFKLLQELEKNGFNPSSSKEPSVESGAAKISPETSPKEDLRGHPEK